MTNTTKVALYARVSTRDKNQDPENQLRQLRAYAAKMEWEIVAEYVDLASGKSGDREQFKRMFNAARNLEFDVLLFWSLDRFSREGTYETLNHLKRLTDYKVKWRSHQEEFVDSVGPFAEAIVGFLAAIAKQERVRLSERVKAGLARATAEGRHGGRPKAEDDLKLVVKFRKLHDAGTSVRKIAAELDISTTTVQKLKAMAS